METGHPPSLQELCVVVLMRHHAQLEDIGHMPYALVRRVLLKMSAEQLLRLERASPALLLEDEEAWQQLLKKDFPTNVHEVWVARKKDVYEYYLESVRELGPQVLEDRALVRSLLRAAVCKDPVLFKYRVPSRQLYQRYVHEDARRQELSAARLRQSTLQLQQEKQKTRITQLEDPLYLERELNAGRQRAAPQRSSIYLKSFKELRQRQAHFRSGGYDPTQRRIVRVQTPSAQPAASLHPPPQSAPMAGSPQKPAPPEQPLAASPTPEAPGPLAQRRRPSARRQPPPASPAKRRSALFSSPALSTLLPQQDDTDSDTGGRPPKKPRVYIHTPR
ncbi:ABL197Cp [Eremothecium gossypii ATCC 10895]|uniref:Elongin-A n=1 Tax=Eremothecium gossypii (strain ATCC 10895 / CBS 109.51 / FGSC 9923 / NRRL Y-1056) TaxID=284811 RepID=ELOA1_EREGS|nr:ABL197Cp [Eremothecium gossypii ATCC 10895]Q75E67.1 RecName: Full=Elongin-A [Eremothecium gossypii ATCC 10895]AAS50574.1 ABL197Cp [Eremothecium gossypii ATCC 10895]AEY94862.1 FABL197Cp [Eremothecium gossypii FDAG1]